MNDRIYTELKRRIVLLDYEPGEVLREKDLIEEFGVSRTPVREALIRLEGEGLVRIIPNRGTIVTEVSFQNLKDVFEIRSYLLQLAGRLAAARITAEELQALRAHIATMNRETDPKVLMRLDLELHDLLNGATKNHALERILEILRNQAVRIWSFTKDTNGYFTGLAREFEPLLEALERRDEEASAKILSEHSDRFVEHVRSEL